MSQSPINNYFDHVYCLNLGKRQDKWANVQSAFEELGIAVERISAIDGDSISEDLIKKYSNLKKGEIGCMLSHYKIIEDAKLKKYKRILVFEDDVIFAKNFNEKLSNQIGKIKDWKILHIGSSQCNWKDVEFGDGFYYSKRTLGTFAIAFDESIYDEILSMRSVNAPIDAKLVNNQHRHYKECYTFYPNLVIADTANSDIRKGKSLGSYKDAVRWNLSLYDIKEYKSGQDDTHIAINEQKEKIKPEKEVKIVHTKQPLSIVISAYEAQDFIEECLDSIQNQTYFQNFDDYEILVGVDGCEKTLKKLLDIQHKYENLHIYIMDSNMGTYVTTNTLVSISKYENIIRFDADDIMLPELIEEASKHFSEYDIVRWQYHDYKNNAITSKSNRGANGALFLKKSIFNKMGGYRDWKCAADSEFLQRASTVSKQFVIEKPLMLYRIHDKSLTNIKETAMKSAIREEYHKKISNKFEYIVPKVNTFKILENPNNKFSIVIPTMWCSDKIHTMLHVYEKCPLVGEIIIIDNNPNNSPNLNIFKKIKKYTKGENIYVNPSWNWGYSLSKYKLILANDDIIINELEKTLMLLLNTDYDIVGIDIKNKNDDCIKIAPIDTFPANSYGCFMYVKNYFYIPEQFKIWYGDAFLFNFNKKRGVLKNTEIISSKSSTIDSNKSFFREKIGKEDIDEYNIISAETSNKINIIIRTSGRPIYFNNCIASIKKNCPNAFLHIILDNPNDIEYVQNCTNGINYKYYFVNQEFVSNICNKIKIERTPFIYNYYFNIVKPFLNGWCMVLDDDDILLTTPKFEDNLNNIYLHKTDIGTKIVPSNVNFGIKPVLNDISSLSIIWHSSQMVNWIPQRGGDYDFINEMHKKNNSVWIDKVLSSVQTGGNFGKRNDAFEHNKPITVNMATYPEREQSFLKTINSLLKIQTIDFIRIYLNEYKNIPENFPRDKKLMYFIGKQNLKDSGKFYWANSTNEYYFTVDDDLIYPESYFINHITLLQKYECKIFVTLHGKVMKEHPTWMNDYLEIFHCLKDVDNDTWINNGGTGVMLFDSGHFNIPLDIFKYHGMADLCIASYAQEKKIPILCRKHQKNELQYIEAKDTLYDQRAKLKDMHKDILNQINAWKIHKIN